MMMQLKKVKLDNLGNAVDMTQTAEKNNDQFDSNNIEVNIMAISTQPLKGNELLTFIQNNRGAGANTISKA